MRISKSRVAYLLKAYSGGKATAAEEQELFNWVAQGNEKPVKEHIENLVSAYNSFDKMPEVDWDNLYENILKEKNSRDADPPVRKISWLYWAAAAAVLILMGISYFYITPSNKEKKNIAIEQPKTDDIAAPHSTNAILTLSNGQKIILDSAGNGTLAVQGSVKINKLPNGQIVYRGTGHEVQYNTLSNPRGSKVVSLTLADGTKVWLNAASSLRYPTAFTGNERKVEITGEAYLEVAHDPSMPFIVSKGKTSIKVLGTHFNVNGYDDENTLNVTLLEGKVSVTNMVSRKVKVIDPGEQACVNKNGDIELNNSADLNEVMAWKNGLFSFKGAELKNIMREISRWYDVNIEFESPVHEKFYAEVSRNTNVSTLLKMLEETKAVHFKINANTIIVVPGTLSGRH